jgi:hypothetical protein
MVPIREEQKKIQAGIQRRLRWKKVELLRYVKGDPDDKILSQMREFASKRCSKVFKSGLGGIGCWSQVAIELV